MRYFSIEPEVAGDLGENTIMDSNRHPPLVKKLHYEFITWLGDALLESFPCFIVTESGMKKLQAASLTGINFGPVEVTASEEFQDFYPDRKLPTFAWMQAQGVPGQDDFSIGPDFRLVVSERALQVLRELGISHAKVQGL